jgi:deoxyhypusine synthase
MEKKDLLKQTIEHIDVKSFDSAPVIDSMRKMSFTSRETANAADILQRMIRDKECSIILTLAGSTSAGGCMQVYVDMVKSNMIDAIVATGASIVDMDFFEALGFKHYRGTPYIDDSMLRNNYIDRIYDTYIMKRSFNIVTKQSGSLQIPLNRGLILHVNLSKRWAGTLQHTQLKKIPSYRFAMSMTFRSSAPLFPTAVLVLAW